MDEDEKKYETYKLMINARNFHYSNFNKWMNFFYVAEGAIFLTYFNLKDYYNKPMFSLLGLIISFLGYLSCKGHYFWIYNWASQIHKFEQGIEIKYRIYSLFSKKVKVEKDNLFHPLKAANISTSKISLLFFFVICIVWAFLFTHSFTKKILGDLCLSRSWFLSILISFLIVYTLILMSYILRNLLKSDIDHHFEV